jgi:hypothetical protein
LAKIDPNIGFREKRIFFAQNVSKSPKKIMIISLAPDEHGDLQQPIFVPSLLFFAELSLHNVGFFAVLTAFYKLLGNATWSAFTYY